MQLIHTKQTLCLEDTSEHWEAKTFSEPEKMISTIKEQDEEDPDDFCTHLDEVTAELNSCFDDLNVMEDIATFFSNPFQHIEIEHIAAELHYAFSLQTIEDKEINDLHNYMKLIARLRDNDFWGLLSRDKFPLLIIYALKLNTYFGSTYL